MIYRVRVAAEAQELIDELDVWWEENRPASSLQLSSEIQSILATLAEMPRCGRFYQRIGEEEVRQYPVRGTPYSLYYVVNDDDSELVVISAWSRVRGKGPPL